MEIYTLSIRTSKIVEKFNTAFISGDNETLKNMLSEDFKWFTPSDRTPRNLSQLLSTSTYLSNNVINLEIKHRGGSYPDVLEYDQDGISDVKTYERMSGYDKNTGVDLTMPRYATFRINKQGKIIRMWVNDDQLLWKKAPRSLWYSKKWCDLQRPSIYFQIFA